MPISVRSHPGREIISSSPQYTPTVDQIVKFDPDNYSIPSLGEKEWELLIRLTDSSQYGKFKDIAQALPGELMITQAFDSSLLVEADKGIEIVRGANIACYEYNSNPKQGERWYLDAEKYLKTQRAGSKAYDYLEPRLIYQRTAAIDNYRRLIATIIPAGKFCLGTASYLKEPTYGIYMLLTLFNTKLLDWRFSLTSTNNYVNGYEVEALPIPRIDFTTPADEREGLTEQITGAYSIGDNAGVLKRVQAVLGENQSDVVHDVLAHLAQRMIDLNKEKQAEVGRFLGWLEDALTPLAPSPTGEGESGRVSKAAKSGVRIDDFQGKTIIQGYLGDYQKGEGEVSWQNFVYRLHQNRNRFGVSLTAIEGEIEIEYEKSLEKLIPIKQDLARTDALIDKIVYRLYGLSDAEIELIERPQYEQALTDAKAQVIKDDNIKDDEDKIEKIAEGILPAAKRFFERVEPLDVMAKLDVDLPKWQQLPPEIPTFLQTGDYNLQTMPEHFDFSSSVIPYTKSVEVLLDKLVFKPFRDQYTEAEVDNAVFKQYMSGKKKDMTLGNYVYIVPSSKEKQLHQFMATVFSDIQPILRALKDNAQVALRNDAAHDEVLSKDQARLVREWAFAILRMV